MLRVPKEDNPHQKFPLLHFEWETQSGGKKRKLKLIVGPILGLILLALLGKGWQGVQALIEWIFSR